MASLKHVKRRTTARKIRITSHKISAIIADIHCTFHEQQLLHFLAFLASFILPVAVSTRRRVSWYKQPGPAVGKGARDPYCIAYVFEILGGIIICLLYKLTFHTKPKSLLQLRVSLSDLVQRFSASPPLPGPPNFSPPPPSQQMFEPTFGGPGQSSTAHVFSPWLLLLPSCSKNVPSVKKSRKLTETPRCC